GLGLLRVHLHHHPYAARQSPWDGYLLIADQRHGSHADSACSLGRERRSQVLSRGEEDRGDDVVVVDAVGSQQLEQEFVRGLEYQLGGVLCDGGRTSDTSQPPWLIHGVECTRHPSRHRPSFCRPVTYGMPPSHGTTWFDLSADQR